MMNMAEWLTIICLPLAILSDCSQLKSEFEQPAQCTSEIVEIVKTVSEVKTIDDLPPAIRSKIETDMFGSALLAWLFLGLIFYAVKSFVSNRRRGW